jgi:hypothetical protein
MDLDSLIVPESVAHPTPIVTCTIEGILEPEDLARLLSPGVGPPSNNPPSLSIDEDAMVDGDLCKIREKHHSVARALASGIPPGLVGRIAGYTASYISILQNSPAMKELIEMYRIQQGAASAVISERLRTVGLKAVEKLEQKMDADQLNGQELLGAAKLGLDRSGHGPQSTTHVVDEHHLIDHARIAELNQRAREGSADYIVPVKDVRQALLPQPRQDDDAA